MKKKKILCGLLTGCLAVSVLDGQTFPTFFSAAMSQAAVIMNMDGTVAVTTLKVKKIAGGKANVKAENGSVISLSKGKKVTIKSRVSKNGKKWYYISFKYKKVTYQGYVRKKKITISENTDKQEKTGKVDATFLNVRIGAGVSNDVLKYQGDSVALKKDSSVTILAEDNSTGELWYQVSFMYGGEELSGFVSGKYILLETEEETASEQEKNTEDNNTDISNIVTSNDALDTTENVASIVLTDEEFEAAMTEQGFPESYKPYLRKLHSLHPTWSFEAYNTGLKWDTVITKQSKVGRNLVPKSKNIAWKSLEQGAYDWASDTFIIFDGTTWVSASEDAIKYYMDPRNFLDETGIYQFELLSYNNSYQTLEGVKTILNNTPMEGETSYSYIDPDTGNSAKITYANTFIKAAELSDVSPYHLASRIRQEVVVSSTTFSGSATGTYSGYSGYYNFYNIGANDSAGGGAIVNGLTYAQKTNSTYLLPWTSPYRSIVGGAVYIGKSYINKGQNTLYLEKFNVTPTDTYNHQYMTNVEASDSESQKIAAAYKEMGQLPLVFSIPVYTNMPETACAIPEDAKNPNNWLKNLSITGYTLTPTFQVSDDPQTVYSLIVDNSVDSIKINATAVSTSASISGTGKQTLKTGTNTFTVKVTAENGDVREYTLNIVKNK